MTETTLFLLIIGIVLVSIALAGTIDPRVVPGPREMTQGLRSASHAVAQGLRGALAWIGTGLATYGLVFGYTGAAAPFLLSEKQETDRARMRAGAAGRAGADDRSIASKAAHVFGAP